MRTERRAPRSSTAAAVALVAGLAAALTGCSSSGSDTAAPASPGSASAAAGSSAAGGASGSSGASGSAASAPRVTAPLDQLVPTPAEAPDYGLTVADPKELGNALDLAKDAAGSIKSDPPECATADKLQLMFPPDPAVTALRKGMVGPNAVLHVVTTAEAKPPADVDERFRTCAHFTSTMTLMPGMETKVEQTMEKLPATAPEGVVNFLAVKTTSHTATQGISVDQMSVHYSGTLRGISFETQVNSPKGGAGSELTAQVEKLFAQQADKIRKAS